MQQTFVKLQHQKFPGVLPSTYLRKKVFIKTISMEKKRENYVAPIAETIEIVIEQAVLSASTETEAPDFGYGGNLSN